MLVNLEVKLLDHTPSGLDRLALPAGDRLSWGVLVAGTLLEGVRWPGFGTLGWDSPLGELAQAPR